MVAVLVHFLFGTIGSLVMFLAFSGLEGVRRFSAPFVIFLAGFICANLAYFVSPWATPLILLIYFLGLLQEHRE
ncbi:hypothetical protein [Picosynechococcus sp. PCC 73109]|uniref:hypothetical protein n=1 Tax=Picosynechococcus sp. PCC 73109 TaxID=374982 RepID=UPI00074589F9|nr:hypothetical protein [Picosynechococcus sp. PCC 73109]AMA10672.1 hypothetical protein AWQ23_14600 [Picosynechococcus sp. PCC 73109]